jgi:hypothetical protein
MNLVEFQEKWRGVVLKESAAAKEHFLDLCRVLGMPTPAEADKTGAFYTFEKGATKTSGGQGFAVALHGAPAETSDEEIYASRLAINRAQTTSAKRGAVDS